MRAPFAALLALTGSVAVAAGVFFVAAALDLGHARFAGTVFAASKPPRASEAFATAAPQAGANGPAVLKVVTYNIRSCEGLDGKYRCDRIANILRKINPDVIALEEVRAEQADQIGKLLGYHVFFGHADTVHGYNFGNAILTRLAIRGRRIYPIGVPGRQQRACLRADLAWPSGGQTLHVFAVHLGLSPAERKQQGERLASAEILANPAIQNEPRILLGDFNETFRHQDVNHSLKPLLHLIGKRSWPAPLPFIDLDRVYYSNDLKRVSAHVYRSGSALIASDHAPLVAVLEKTTATRASAAIPTGR